MTGPRFYGVGVGPGAPDLLTLRAASLLRQVPVVAAPRATEEADSLSLRTARAAVGPVAGQETLLLTFPMTRDVAVRRAAREAAARAIAERLESGLSVAFVTEGDPLIYSTFLDLLAEAPRVFPRFPVEVVPGISSITAAGAAALLPLADGEGRMAILPAPTVLPDLGRLARQFETLVILKSGGVLSELRRALSTEGLLDRAVLVCNASTDRQQVVRDLATFDERPGYFCTVLVTRKPEEIL